MLQVFGGNRRALRASVDTQEASAAVAQARSRELQTLRNGALQHGQRTLKLLDDNKRTNQNLRVLDAFRRRLNLTTAQREMYGPLAEMPISATIIQILNDYDKIFLEVFSSDLDLKGTSERAVASIASAKEKLPLVQRDLKYLCVDVVRQREATLKAIHDHVQKLVDVVMLLEVHIGNTNDENRRLEAEVTEHRRVVEGLQGQLDHVTRQWTETSRLLEEKRAQHSQAETRLLNCSNSDEYEERQRHRRLKEDADKLSTDVIQFENQRREQSAGIDTVNRQIREHISRIAECARRQQNTVIYEQLIEQMEKQREVVFQSLMSVVEVGTEAQNLGWLLENIEEHGNSEVDDAVLYSAGRTCVKLAMYAEFSSTAQKAVAFGDCGSSEEVFQNTIDYASQLSDRVIASHTPAVRSTPVQAITGFLGSLWH